MAASSSSSSGEQQYALKWNDFQSSILSSFRHLLDEEDFVDVTLACDSSSFTAHKVVLSACSPYFRRLLKANPCQHPIVILRDVASSDMESLLRFMYHGEVHVGEEKLATFLKTAQMLQVRGLADVNGGSAASKIPQLSTSTGNNASSPVTPRNPWQDSVRGDLNESGLSPPPQKRPRSYSPAMSNHVEPKSDLQESLLGQALEGGPTIHTTPNNNVQAQSTGEDSNSMSDNEEDTSNNDGMLNSVKTEPSDILNDSMEHHRSTFPAALLGLQGLMPGPSGIHAANQDPNYGRWQPPPSDGNGSCSSSGWLANTAGGTSSTTRNDHPGTHPADKQDFTTTLSLSTGSTTLTRLHHHQHQHQQQQQQQSHHLDNQQQAAGLNSLSSLNSEQLNAMHQKLQNNLQSLQQQVTATGSTSLVKSTTEQLNMMLQSCAKQQKHVKHHQLETGISQLLNQIRDPYVHHHQHQQQMGGIGMDSIGLNGKPKCPECGKIYSNNSNLKQHIVNVHTIQTEYISCHVCNKQFKTKQYLQIHLLSMHGIRKRKSYPVYQSAQTLAQQLQQAANSGHMSQQYASSDSWTDEKN